MLQNIEAAAKAVWLTLKTVNTEHWTLDTGYWTLTMI